MRIETARLSLAPITVADAEEMSRVLADESLYELTGGAPEGAAQLATRYARWVAGPTKPAQRWVNLVVRLRGDAIGYVQATVNAAACDLAWVIGRPWQGQGFATEAVRALMTRIGPTTFRASIRPDHLASRRVAEKLGLQPTTTLAGDELVWLSP